jgi:hypothetical protein
LQIVRALKWTFGITLLIVGAIAAYPFVTYKDHRVSTGSAYGFVVGETATQTYERAMPQLQSGRFVAFELGQGSAAEAYLGNDQTAALSFDHWKMVVDEDWWNNTIYLSFANGVLIEIWRFRLCCEMP